MEKEPTTPTTAESIQCVSGSVLAKRYTLHPKTIHKLGEEGVLPRVRIGGRCFRYNLSECDAVMSGIREPRTAA